MHEIFLVTPELAMQWSVKEVAQWREMQLQKTSNGSVGLQNRQNEASRWVAPAAGSFKLNVDASVFHRIAGAVLVFEAEA